MKKIFSILFLALTFNGMSQTVGLNIGNKAPEIALPSPNGEVLKLSSLKGQMVLIDFWASWCGPCRYENPNVVKAYQSYKDATFQNAKKFVVFNVSLDKNIDQWKAAIVADKLDWPYHVSDLKGWLNQAAQTYHIESIPSNVLIDGNGIIVAKNLRGEALIQKLESLKK